MNQEKGNIDHHFKEKLIAYEVSPPDSVWKGIEKSLDRKRKKAVVIFYQRLAIAAAILLLAAFSFYFIKSEKVEVENKISQNQENEVSKPKKEAVLEHKPENLISEISDTKANENILIESDQNNTPNGATLLRLAQKTIFSNNEINRQLVSKLNKKESLVSENISSLQKRNKTRSSLKSYLIKKNNKYKELLAILEQKELKSNTKNWSIGLTYSPTQVNRSGSNFVFANSAFYDAANGALDAISEKDLPAFRTGLNLVYQFSRRWSFQTGIFYLKQGQSIENFGVLNNSANSSFNTNSFYGNIVFTDPISISEANSLGDKIHLSDIVSFSRIDANLIQQFELIDIPLIAQYKLIDRTFELFILAGLNQGILVNNSVYLNTRSSNSIGKTEGINALIYKSVFGISMEYPIARKLYFNFSPTLKYQLNNFNKYNVESENLQYFEFKTGLNYRF